MTDVRGRIAALNDEEAVKVAAFVTQSLRADLQQGHELPADLQNGLLNDDQAADLLRDAFPQFPAAIVTTRSTSSSSERGRAAKNFLVVLADEDEYSSRINSAINQLQFVADPVTLAAVAAGIVFLLSIKFRVTSKIVKGERRIDWEVSRDATPVELVMKILGVGSADAQKSIDSGAPKSIESGTESDTNPK